MSQDDYKFCRSCSFLRRAERFHKDRRSPDGLARRCRDCVSKATRAWAKRNRDRKNATDRAWKRRNRRKDHAHGAVRTALRTGRLIKRPCEVCGAARVEAHHPDYRRKLLVQWLCKRHHAAVHTWGARVSKYAAVRRGSISPRPTSKRD